MQTTTPSLGHATWQTLRHERFLCVEKTSSKVDGKLQKDGFGARPSHLQQTFYLKGKAWLATGPSQNRLALAASGRVARAIQHEPASVLSTKSRSQADPASTLCKLEGVHLRPMDPWSANKPHEQVISSPISSTNAALLLLPHRSDLLLGLEGQARAPLYPLMEEEEL